MNYSKENNINDSGEDTPKFALIYLDDDDIPELVIPEGHYHAAGCELYCYDGKGVKLLGEYGSWGGFGYRPESGVFCDGNMSSAGEWTAYSKYENGTVTELGSVSSEMKSWDSDPTDPENYDYYINKKPVTYAEYQEKESKIRETYKLDKIINTSTHENYKLTEEDINRI